MVLHLPTLEHLLVVLDMGMERAEGTITGVEEELEELLEVREEVVVVDEVEKEGAGLQIRYRQEIGKYNSFFIL